VRVARDISIEPPHVELSLRKGGNRLQALTIRNGSQQNVVANIKPIPLHGNLHELVSFRPDSIDLKAGQTRKVLVMLSGRPDVEQHSYAYARIEVLPEIGHSIGTQDIPVALLTNSEALPEIAPTELGWFTDRGRSGFRIPVKNLGYRHLELQGRLTLRDQFGRGIVLEDGFGRWVLPGQEDQLLFGFRESPPPGTYNVHVEIQRTQDLDPFVLEQTIELRDTTEEKVSSEEPEGVLK
ncbi:MAG: hypothetical protein KDA81_22265, partial [Planctomycetaceae bacterium]|nr:hypothetical protein [Planctomycetaceae bacterium]